MVVRFAPTEAGDWDYRVNSNIPEWDGKTGTFTAAASPSPGFIHPENVHHWAYSERDARGSTRRICGWAPARCASPSRTTPHFERWPTRAPRRSSTTCAASSAARAPTAPTRVRTRRISTQFRRLDERIRYLNSKGITADLILARTARRLTKAFPSWQQRRRFLRYLVGRYAAMNVTWQGVQYFEDSVDTRALLKEAGAVLKELDGYQHPRTSGARVTSAPLLDDGWMDFAAYGNTDDQVGAIEHQLYRRAVRQSGLRARRQRGGEERPGRRGCRGPPQAAVERHHERPIGDLRQHR